MIDCWCGVRVKLYKGYFFRGLIMLALGPMYLWLIIEAEILNSGNAFLLGLVWRGFEVDVGIIFHFLIKILVLHCFL